MEAMASISNEKYHPLRHVNYQPLSHITSSLSYHIISHISHHLISHHLFHPLKHVNYLPLPLKYGKYIKFVKAIHRHTHSNTSDMHYYLRNASKKKKRTTPTEIRQVRQTCPIETCDGRAAQVLLADHTHVSHHHTQGSHIIKTSHITYWQIEICPPKS